jgi:protein involved in polysaccharide export with SLBB domain
MLKITSYILIFIFLICLSQSVYSQQNTYKNIKVDQLSDDQLKTMIQRAESIGFSDLQLEQIALEEGMDKEEVAKLKSRLEQIRKKEENRERSFLNDNKNDYNRDFRRQLNYPVDTGSQKNTSKPDLDRKKFSEYDFIPVDSDSLKLKIFGSDLFNTKNLTFQPDLNMPTPKGYIIGPNDELLIDITGDNEVSYNLTVSPEGFINVEYVGRVAVGGLSIEAASSKIKNSLTTAFPAIKSGRTQVSLNLGNIRSIKITLIGEINKPGTYTLPSLATVFNALYASGGPNENGSFRKIQVLRNNSIISTIDIYDFLLKGMQVDNIGLQDQDVIYVPVFETRVEMKGEVKRPAIYEMLDGESLQDVLNFSGGFTTRAYTANVKVFQNTQRERRIVDVFTDEFSTYEPKNGDQYVVEPILDRFENRVQIKGSVYRPGAFEVRPGMTLKELIERAGGVKEEAFLARAYIYRLKPDDTQELLSFNVGQLLNGTTSDIPLQREDIVQISSIFDIRDEYKVTIQGEVRQPRAFPYVENMTVGDLIQMAGGFKEGASSTRLEIARRKNNIDVSSSSASAAEVYTIDVDKNLEIKDKEFVLQPYDIVSIRSDSGVEPQMQVLIEGEVLFPGFYTITKKDDRISDVIMRSGGLTAFAYPHGASLKRPSTENKQKKKEPGLDWFLEVDEQKVEQERKLLNLRRLSQDNNTQNTLEDEDFEEIISSDLVGINLDKILTNPNSRWDLILEDGDIIQVPKILQTVKITGEVRRPNNVVYQKRKNFKTYIKGAGGFTRNASKKGAYIQYANGSVDATSKVLFFNRYPAVEPGAEIFVPDRGPREKVSAQGWVAISTAMVSMAAMIFSILK